MTDREKLIARLNASFEMQHSKRGLLTAQHTADDLISYGVTFAKDTNAPDNPVVPGHDDQYNIAEMSYNNGYAKGLEDGKPKWIPVSERLPTPYVDVITCRRDFLARATTIGKEYITIRDNEIPSWSQDYRTWKSKVTHWMPLPEPLKEETDG